MSGRPPGLETARRKNAGRGRLLAVTVSVAAHVLALGGLLLSRPASPPVEPESIIVSMVEPPAPPPPPPPPPETAPRTEEPSPAKAARPRSPARPTAAPPDIEPIQAAKVATPELVVGLGDSDLVGAATAGSGSGGGAGCNMVRLLQIALRKNPRVQAAVAAAHPETIRAGRAILVWDGDWVRTNTQEGKGLAGIRQAIAMEVAFAPEACRAEPVRGLVLISLKDGPGAPRLALGSRTWRWSDLLFAR
ncbi:hypothetical protein [Caulobacter sp. DWR1-3-2b1]|uniref:hypothetical protein n=1 Tax=Caulobacter sp. DWR1-3-2b1 TaxID=2804670 RepID=UPI003CEC6A31